MPYNSGALILKFLFQVADSLEVAETQLSLSSGPGPNYLTAFGQWTAGDLEDCAELYGGLMGSGGLYWGSYSQLKGMKLAAVGTDGHYLAEPLTADLGAGYQGSGAHVPPQCSVVVSLSSGFTIGSANRGRMYLPHTIMPLASFSPFASTTDVNTLATSAKTFLDGINEISRGKGIETTIVVRSSKGAGSTKEVHDVRIGSLIDTQQRRRRQLNEAYITKALVPA